MNKMLFDQFEREVIIKYNGMYGFKMPDYAPSIVIRYNIIHIQREAIRVLRINEIINWLKKQL